MNYGLTYTGRWQGGRILYDIDNRYNLALSHNLTFYAEKAGFAGLTYRFEANNLTDHETCPKRVRYDGNILNSIAKEYEFACSTTGRSFALIVRGNF